MVLLKNEDSLLPLSPSRKTAVIGPLGDDQHDMLGPWWGQGRDEDAVSLFTGLKAQNPDTTFTQGCTRKEPRAAGTRGTTTARATSTWRRSPRPARPTRSCSPSARRGR